MRLICVGPRSIIVQSILLLLPLYGTHPGPLTQTSTNPLHYKINKIKTQGIEQELERSARKQAERKGAKEPFLTVYRTMGEHMLHRLRYDRSESVPQVRAWWCFGWLLFAVRCCAVLCCAVLWTGSTRNT
jgi:hypothetical protein